MVILTTLSELIPVPSVATAVAPVPPPPVVIVVGSPLGVESSESGMPSPSVSIIPGFDVLDLFQK